MKLLVQKLVINPKPQLTQQLLVGANCWATIQILMINLIILYFTVGLRRCSVIECPNNTLEGTRPGTVFFPIPEVDSIDQDSTLFKVTTIRRKAWLDRIGVTELNPSTTKNFFVCSDHFASGNDFNLIWWLFCCNLYIHRVQESRRMCRKSIISTGSRCSPFRTAENGSKRDDLYKQIFWISNIRIFGPIKILLMVPGLSFCFSLIK